MTQLKLAKLPERVPIKLTICVTPELKHRLDDYARAYAEAYGQEESVAELIPAMLSADIESDRSFARGRK